MYPFDVRAYARTYHLLDVHTFNVVVVEKLPSLVPDTAILVPDDAVTDELVPYTKPRS